MTAYDLPPRVSLLKATEKPGLVEVCAVTNPKLNGILSE
jgi:hypothetical protein